MENSIRNLFVIVFLLIAAMGCGKKEASESETDFTKVTNVEIYTVTASSFEDYISLPVVVMPNREVNLGLVGGGKVTRILVDKGDRVKKDMILLETDDTLLSASYDQARASLEYQKKEFARSEKLYSDGSISTAAYDAAELQFASAQSSYDMAKKQYEDAKLKAPFSGVVTMRNVEVGAILGPGTPAFRIIDVSKVKVQAGIPEKYIAEFKVGNMVTISFDALS
ncbi:efflux RND transporter periplasmic adaptor subunit, partial [Candidatus Latescibacterota bacterium]